jgi:adenosylmethionine-8-amino-7-oxononanoate aminotransferase
MSSPLRIWHPFTNAALDPPPLRGVLLRPLGNVVYVLPPYVISPDELHRVYDVILEAIQTLF